MTKQATMDVKYCPADEYLRGLKDNFIDLTIIDSPYMYNGLKSVKHSKIDKHGIKSKPQLSKAFKAINDSALGGGWNSAARSGRYDNKKLQGKKNRWRKIL